MGEIGAIADPLGGDDGQPLGHLVHGVGVARAQAAEVLPGLLLGRQRKPRCVESSTFRSAKLSSVGERKVNKARPRQDSLRMLVKNVQISVGTILYHEVRRYPERRAEAIVVPGGLSVKGRTYSSPSSAAVAVAGHQVNGWTFWKLKDSGAPLRTIRSQETAG